MLSFRGQLFGTRSLGIDPGSERGIDAFECCDGERFPQWSIHIYLAKGSSQQHTNRVLIVGWWFGRRCDQLFDSGMGVLAGGRSAKTINVKLFPNLVFTFIEGRASDMERFGDGKQRNMIA